MLMQSKRKPLLTCDVLHSLSGRIRIGCRALLHLGAHRREIEDRLESDFAISRATVSPLSENVLVFFDNKKTNAKEIFEITENIIASYSTIAYKSDREEQNKQTVQERRLQEEPISEMLGRIGINTLTLAYFFFKKTGTPDNIFRKIYQY